MERTVGVTGESRAGREGERPQLQLERDVQRAAEQLASHLVVLSAWVVAIEDELRELRWREQDALTSELRQFVALAYEVFYAIDVAVRECRAQVSSATEGRMLQQEPQPERPDGDEEEKVG